MEVHLPCPPLAEWLPVLLADRCVGAWIGRGTPRLVRGVLGTWPRLEPADEGQTRPSALELASLDALLFGVRLERPDPPEACLQLLRPGTQIIELAVPRRRVVRQLLGAERPPAARAASGQGRVLQWLARGYAQLEQWESVEPHGVIVTLARSR